jgi:hypothetical protein
MRVSKIGFNLRASLLLLTAALCHAGCANPSGLPVFREIRERERQETARHTEEALKNSPVMRELDDLCRGEVPVFEGFVFLSMDASYPPRTFLTYFYSSDADYEKVKGFYTNYFTEKGWQLSRRDEDGWGSLTIEFRKESYKIIIFHKGMGGKADYALHCEKLTP